MSARISCIIVALVLGVSTASFGQVGTGFTITDGDVVFSQVNSPTVGTVGSVSGANMRVNGPAGQDNLFENWWWFRQAGVDTREFAFNSAVGTVVGPANTAVTTWNFANFAATLTYVANDTGALAGQVTETMIVRNTTPEPITLNLYNYVDFDANATAATDSAVLVGTDLMRITDGPATAQFEGVARTNYQVTAFATLRGLLTNAVVNDLNNTGLPFGPGDFTGAFQWTLQLAPNQPVTVVERLSLQIPEPASLALLGLAGLALIRRR